MWTHPLSCPEDGSTAGRDRGRDRAASDRSGGVVASAMGGAIASARAHRGLAHRDVTARTRWGRDQGRDRRT
jgi:hypothetical protein